MKRRIGRSTTIWMATVIKTPISTSDTPASVSAQNRIRPISSSERCAENFTATAPATAPSSVIGAITSQWCSPPLLTARETTRPRCTSSASLQLNDSWLLGSFEATSVVPSASKVRTSSWSTVGRISRKRTMSWWSAGPLPSSRPPPIAAATSRA